MRVITSLAVAAIMASAVIVAPEALAQRRGNQGTNVVVLDYARVVSESALGRDMSAKLQVVRGQVAQEAQSLQPEQQSLEQERSRLQQATRNMTPEQISNSTTYRPQFESLAQRVQQFQSRGSALQGSLECTQAIALRDFNNQVTPVVQTVMQSRGAQVVLDRSNIQMAQPEADITNTVIQQLDQNQATRTANVVRHQVAECQQQQPAQPQAPQQ